MTKNFIYKNIKIYNGGSTGLVQQKNIRRSKPKRKSESILISIKNASKSAFGFDIVAIQAGSTYNFVEEDADFTQKQFGWKNIGINFSLTGCAVNNSLKNRFMNLGLKYCILNQTDMGEKMIERTIVQSNIEDSLDWKILTPNSAYSKSKIMEVRYKGNTKTIENTSQLSKYQDTKIFMTGEKVVHKIYGIGIVLSQLNEKVEVDFSNKNQIKVILSSFLQTADD